MIKLETLAIRRFKQLKEFELTLQETNVLIGANNAGKSSVLQALHFAVSVAQTSKIVGEGVNWAADKFQVSFNPGLLIYSPVGDVLQLAFGGTLQESVAKQIEIAIACSDGTKATVSVRRGRNRNIGVTLTGRSLGERLMDLDHPFTVYAPGLAGIPKEERYMSPGAVRRIVARGDANLVLRNVLLMLKRRGEVERLARVAQVKAGNIKTVAEGGWKSVWIAFLDDMQTIFPGIQLNVTFDEERDEFIEVFFKRSGGEELPLDAAGTSVLQACQILAYIALFKPNVLILDEPDSHLHPNNQRLLCNLIASLASTREFRALISTHSRHVLDAMRDEASIVWVSQGKRVDYDSVDTASMLMEIGALDSLDYFTNGHLRCLFATEDDSKDSLKALHVLLESNGFNMTDTELRPYAGCSKIDAAKVLRRFLLDKAPSVKFVVHRDRDYMADDAAERFEKGIETLDAFAFLTDLSEVENYFLNAAHLAQLNPLVSVERAQQLLDEATVSTRDASIKRLINLRTNEALANRVGGEAIDAGDLAIKATKDYDADPTRWRRGKIVLGAVAALIQSETKQNATYLSSTPHLKTQGLRDIAQKIWPNS